MGVSKRFDKVGLLDTKFSKGDVISIKDEDIYELPSMSNIKNFHEFVGENKKLQELNCDVLFFNDCIGYKHQQNVVNRKALDTIKNGDINCTWIDPATLKYYKDIVERRFKTNQNMR